MKIVMILNLTAILDTLAIAFTTFIIGSNVQMMIYYGMIWGSLFNVWVFWELFHIYLAWRLQHEG